MPIYWPTHLQLIYSGIFFGVIYEDTGMIPRTHFSGEGARYLVCSNTNT